MKLTIAASILASSISAEAKSLPDPSGKLIRNAVDDSQNSNRHSLSVSTPSDDISAFFKERRSTRKQNNNVIRNIQRKLRNQAGKNGDSSDAELDLGFLSRHLQENITDTEEEQSTMDQLIELCSNTNVDGISCTCTNVDADAYTANVVCAYDESCLEPTENFCKTDVTFCFVETYELEVRAPGTGQSKICYEVNTPTNFTYCYGLTYPGNESPTTCFLEVDGDLCSSCEFTYVADDPEETCNAFDCTNIDNAIGSGTVCGNETIVSRKIEDYLIYGALPCEGGCNICPGGGEMMNMYNSVTLLTGQSYSCNQLYLAASLGYLNEVPGDLCNALPAIVNVPCECTGGMTTAPELDISEEVSTETDSEGTSGTADTSDGADTSDEASGVDSSAAIFDTRGFQVAGIGASIVSWMML